MRTLCPEFVSHGFLYGEGSGEPWPWPYIVARHIPNVHSAAAAKRREAFTEEQATATAEWLAQNLRHIHNLPLPRDNGIFGEFRGSWDWYSSFLHRRRERCIGGMYPNR